MTAHDHEHHDHHDHPGLSVDVERTGPCSVSVRFRITADEYRRSRTLGLQNAARRTRLKGFRPGKAPLAMIEKMHGPEIDKELIQHFVSHAYERAVKDEGLRPAAQPRIDLEGLQASPEEGLEHEFELLLRPDIELGQVEGMHVDGRPVAVSDDEVDAALGDVKNQFSRPEPAGEEGLASDGMAVCRLEFWRPEAEETVLARDGIRLSPKSAPRGVDEGAFESALIGASEGETREIPFVFPDDFPVEEARGEQGALKVVIEQAFEIVEPTQDELFEAFDATDTESLRSALSERIKKAKDTEEERRLENALLDQLIANHPIEVPEPLVEEQTKARVDELEKALAQQALPASELEQRLEQERHAAREASIRALKAIYLMEEIARTRDLQVREEDFQEEFKSIAERNQAKVDEVRKYYQEQGLIQQLALELLERKVRSFLLGSADIKQA